MFKLWLRLINAYSDQPVWFCKLRQSQWRELDPRPFAYKANALARLSYTGMTYSWRLADLKCSQYVWSASNHFNNHKIWKISMKIKYIKPQKLKVLIALFLERLAWEFLWGYTLQKEYNHFTLHFWVWLIYVWVGLLHTFWWRKNPGFEIAESTREDQNEILNYW